MKKARAHQLRSVPKGGVDTRLYLYLVLISLFGFLLRLIYFYYATQSGYFSRIFLDSALYVKQAQNLHSGIGFDLKQPYHFSPIYPYYLSYFVNSFGVLNLNIIRVLNALVGSLTNLTMSFLVLKLLNRRLAILASLIMACYGPLIYFDGVILFECLQVFTVTLSLCLFIFSRDLPVRLFFSGVALGVSAVLRPTVIPIALSVTVYKYFYNLKIKKPFLKVISIFILGFILPIAPFTIRNFIHTREPVLLTTAGGFNFWIGNHHGASGIFEAPQGYDFDLDPLGKNLASLRAKKVLTEKEASQWWFTQAFNDILNFPIDFGLLFIKKVLYSIHPLEIPVIGPSFQWYKDHSWPLRFPLVATPIFILAILSPFFRNRSGVRIEQFTVSYLFFGVYFLMLCLFFYTDRYRIVIFPIALLLALISIDGFISFIKKQRRLKAVLLSTGATVSLSLFTALYYSPEFPLFLTDISGSEERNYGLMLLEQGKLEEAVAAFKRALLISNHATIRTYLGSTFLKMGRMNEAKLEFQKAIRIDSSYEPALIALSDFSWRIEKNKSEALRILNLALERKQNSIGLLTEIIAIYRESGDKENTEVFYNRFLKVAPKIHP